MSLGSSQAYKRAPLRPVNDPAAEMFEAVGSNRIKDIQKGSVSDPAELPQQVGEPDTLHYRTAVRADRREIARGPFPE